MPKKPVNWGMVAKMIGGYVVQPLEKFYRGRMVTDRDSAAA